MNVFQKAEAEVKLAVAKIRDVFESEKKAVAAVKAESPAIEAAAKAAAQGVADAVVAALLKHGL